MRTFLLIWFGQTVSRCGSGLTSFVLGIWVLQETGSETRFALIALSAVLPQMLLSPLAGALVDRWDRRSAMILSDAGAACGTLAIFALAWYDALEIWHIYAATIFSSCFGAFQWPAFTAATSVLVAKHDLGRTSGLNQLGFALANIVAPLMAGFLFVLLEVRGVILIDLATFIFAVAILFVVRIPRPERKKEDVQGSLKNEIAYGFRWIRERPGFLGLLLMFAVANLIVGMMQVLLTPLVLGFADPVVVGVVSAWAGGGLLLGGIVMSVWGGPRRRMGTIYAILLLQGILLFALGLPPSAFLISSVTFAFFFGNGIVGGCSQALWQTKVDPGVQGRVFAIRRVVATSSLPLAYLAAGPLAEYVFEPMMAEGGLLSGSLGRLLGTGEGRGVGLMFLVLGLILLLTTAFGLSSPRIRRIEDEIPDAIFEAASH